jgi:argininosuccinate synthase
LDASVIAMWLKKNYDAEILPFAAAIGKEEDPHMASMEGVKSTYNQNDATGFIRLNGLCARLAVQDGPKI